MSFFRNKFRNQIMNFNSTYGLHAALQNWCVMLCHGDEWYIRWYGKIRLRYGMRLRLQFELRADPLIECCLFCYCMIDVISPICKTHDSRRNANSSTIKPARECQFQFQFDFRICDSHSVQNAPMPRRPKDFESRQ